MLPILRTGEAIIVGEAVNLPIRTLVDRSSRRRRPESSDPKVVVPQFDDGGFEGPAGWNQPRDPADYAETVELWRRQDPKPLHVQSELGSAELAASPGDGARGESEPNGGACTSIGAPIESSDPE